MTKKAVIDKNIDYKGNVNTTKAKGKRSTDAFFKKKN